MNPSTAFATVVVDELIRGGVRDAVLCPGSRSAPFAFALAAADSVGRLRLHVRIDERSAGFLALGLAKTGAPAVIVTTSGSAVANLHPAVLEAAHGNVALLVLSADRPPELRGTGANQTTDQVGIFGGAPRFCADIGAPAARAGQVASWRAVVSRALAAARGAHPAGAAGPVHLNAPLREPLVPDGELEWLEPLAGRPDGAPWTSPRPAPALPAFGAGAAGVGAAGVRPGGGEPARTLVLVGDLPAGPWGRLAAERAAEQGWPLIAEPSSGGAWAAALPHGPLLLADERWLAAHRPDRVLAIGHLTLGRPLARLLADPRMALDVVSDAAPWPDPGHQARSVAPLSWLASRAGAAAGAAGADRSWAAEWQRAAAAVAAAVGRFLDRTAWPTGLGVAREVLGALPTGATVFLGASNPVRDVQLAAVPGPVTVVTNRGLAGIDGSVSTACGLALTSTGPTYALLGDLTVLHDAGGLVRGPAEPVPDLTLVVPNDNGGGIFGLLEPAAPAHAAVFERVFGTPHRVDLAALCAATGTGYQLLATRAELRAELAAPPRGVRLLEVAVDRAAHAAVHAALRQAAAAALSG